MKEREGERERERERESVGRGCDKFKGGSAFKSCKGDSILKAIVMG